MPTGDRLPFQRRGSSSSIVLKEFQIKIAFLPKLKKFQVGVNDPEKVSEHNGLAPRLAACRVK
jgi:hypothetical protein